MTEAVLNGQTAGGGATGGNLLIESLGVYLPAATLSTDEVVRGCASPLRFPLERITGIRSRRVVADDESAISMAREAALDCLARSRHRPEEIDLLICCNIARTDGPPFRLVFEPCQAVRLKKALGFDQALAFDITNACAAMFTALYVVRGLLETGAIRRAMVVSAEHTTPVLRTAQREIREILDPRLAALTMGDGAAAVIVERSSDPALGFLHLDLCTLGSHSSFCVARASEQSSGGVVLLTDSLRLSAVIIREAVQHFAYAQRSADWSADAFRHVLVHQTSETSLRDAARELNQHFGREVWPAESLISNLEERGNIASATQFIALAESLQAGRIRRGDRVLFGISGSGVTIGTALYAFDDLPDRLRSGSPPEPASSPAAPRSSTRLGKAPPRTRIESIGTIPEGCTDGRSALELSRLAAERCLDGSALPRDAVQLLLYSGVYREGHIIEPAVAAMLAGALGINDAVEADAPRKTLAFDIFNGAVGTLNACYVADQLIRAGSCAAALVTAAEIEYNAVAGVEGRRGLRDTGSALLLCASDDQTGFGTFVFRSATQLSDALQVFGILEEPGIYLRFAFDPRLEEYYLECIDEAVRELLAIEDLDLGRVRVVLPPQISSAFVERLGERLGLPPEVVVALDGQGDYFTSSLAYSLERARELGLVTAGDIGLVIAVGSGLQVGCASYYF